MKRPMTSTERMLATASGNVSSTLSSAAGWVSAGVLGVGLFFFVILSLVVRDQRSGVRDQQNPDLDSSPLFLISDLCSLIPVLVDYMEDGAGAGEGRGRGN